MRFRFYRHVSILAALLVVLLAVAVLVALLTFSIGCDHGRAVPQRIVRILAKLTSLPGVK